RLMFSDRLSGLAKLAGRRTATTRRYIGPYSQHSGSFQPGGPKPSIGQALRDQLLDIKAPTERQKKGAEYGIKKTKQEQKQREKKPRGLIEYYGFGELEYNFGHVGLQYAKLLATEHDHVNAQVELITKQFKNRVEGESRRELLVGDRSYIDYRSCTCKSELPIAYQQFGTPYSWSKICQCLRV